MLHILMADPQGREQKEVWNVGQRNPIQDEDTLLCIYQIRADGNELAHILMRFENLPYVQTTKACKWFGDMAQFIVANLIEGD